MAIVLATAQAEPVRYVLDTDHSYPYFAVRHLGMSELQGRFNKMTGWAEMDMEAKGGKVEVRIEVASLDTGMPLRDKNLLRGVLGTTFFEPEKFPFMTYRSDTVVFEGEQPIRIEGELTLQGVTRKVPIQITHFHCAFNPLRLAKGCGGRAIGRIKRSEFGMAGMPSLIGDEIDLIINVEAYPNISANERPSAR
ncbi:YceI family protein [Chitinivorax sp. B]|uniref:YceI family protein n=1 Tax=Chitinivorax sp. B TaxID=2502235 RepID=UPI0014852632|nr:YceI family protein [Chitinivorax sp. B]